MKFEETYASEPLAKIDAKLQEVTYTIYLIRDELLAYIDCLEAKLRACGSIKTCKSCVSIRKQGNKQAKRIATRKSNKV